jgi:hypothetical protein
VKGIDEKFKSKFLKEVVGNVKIPDGKSFGFIEDVFIHPSIVNKYKFVNGQEITGIVIRTYNKDKGQWSWKLI